MIFIFGILLTISFIRQKDVLFNKKINLILFLLLSACGITLGVIHMIYPYIPSLADLMEKYMK